MAGGDTLSFSGATAAAPAAGATIVDCGTPPAGRYRVTIACGQVGTPDAHYANAVLQDTGVTVASVLTAGVAVRDLGKLTFSGGAVKLVVGASAGGASAVYVGDVQLTRLA